MGVRRSREAGGSMRQARWAPARASRVAAGAAAARGKTCAAIASLGLLFAATGVAEAATAATSRGSVSSNGDQANDYSFTPSISGDGRFVAFASGASNLVPGDTNGAEDVFVHDRSTGQTSRVSVGSDGEQGQSDGGHAPSMSADGRFVAFYSYASNLVAGDTNDNFDVFVHDRTTGQTSRVSAASDGDQANHSSYDPSISADGRYVAFESGASNLVAGDTNGAGDVFVHDRQTGITSRVSVSSDGDQANEINHFPSISADGRYVAFVSYASNLVPGDTNGKADVFVHDRQTGTTSRVSVRSNGDQGIGRSWTPSISSDGRYVAFVSGASNLVSGDTNGKTDVFVHDRTTGQTSRVNVRSNGDQANHPSGSTPSISAHGRYVAFRSGASNLVPGDTNHAVDVFVHDRTTGQTRRVSVRSNGNQANDNSLYPSISADGRYAAFYSDATNLVPGDTNGVPDVFVHGPLY
jgi:Tol biopolymer transport system component